VLQTIHFFYTYFRAVPSAAATNSPATPTASFPPVSFALPTGALGNGIAGVVCLKMGLPVHRLVYATNENDVIDRLMKVCVCVCVRIRWGVVWSEP
jgi:threonine synthase